MVVLTAIFPKECIFADTESQPYTWIVKGIEAEDIYTSDTNELFTESLTDVEHFNLEYATLLMERYSIIKTDNGYNCIDYLGNTLLEEWCSDKLFYLPKGEIAGYNPEVTIERGESGLVFYDYLGGYGGGYETLVWDNQNSYRCLGGPVNDLQGADYSIYISLDQNVPCNFYDNEYTGKYVLASGNEIISDEIYDNVQYGFRSDIYAFEKDGFWYYLNQEGESVLDFGVKTIVNEYGCDECPYLFTDGYVVVSDLNGYSLYDETGKQVIKSGTFNKINSVYNGYAWVQDSETNLWGVIKLNDYTPKEQSDESWRYIYEEKLREIMTEVDSSSAFGWRKFSLEYITDDSIPELVVSGGTFRGPYYTVYTIQNNEIKELATGGSFSYLTGKSTLITQNKSTMYTDTTIYDMNNDTTISLVSGAEYTLDGQTITADEYEALMNSYVNNVLYKEVDSGYEVNEQNIDSVLQLDKLRIIEKFSTDFLPEIDPFVQAHLNFIEENPDAFVNSYDVYSLNQTTNLMKDYDLSVTDYISMKKIQDLFSGEIDFDSDNVILSIQALAAELLCNEQMVEQMNTASQVAIEAGNEQLLEIIKQNEKILNPADTTVETLDLLIKTADKTSDVYKAWRNDFIADFLKNVDFDKFSSVLSARSFAVNRMQENMDNNRELYTFWLTSIGYDAANDSLQEAFDMLVDAVNVAAAPYRTDESEYGKRVKLITTEFIKYHQKLIDVSADKYDIYIEMLGQQEFLGTASQIAAYVITESLEAVIGAVFPELLVIGIVFDVTMSVWEQFTMVDERALERDMYLNMIVFYDAISEAMNDKTNGYAGNLINNKTLHSAYVYEEGVGFYKRITNMMVNHAKLYYAMLYEDINDGKWWNSGSIDMLFLSAGLLGDAYTDKVTGVTGTIEQAKRLLSGTMDEYEETFVSEQLTLAPWTFNSVKKDVLSEIVNIQFSLELFADDVKEMSCHELIVSSSPVVRPDFYVYDIACPVNLTIRHGDTIVAEIANDTLTLLDESVPVSMNIIKEEDDIYASKFVVVPSDYDVEITGYADGTMYFEKAIVENGYLSAISTITDVPVQNGSAYTEVIENNVTVALNCDLNGDGITNEILSAEVTKLEGDIDSDGKITSGDALMILQMVVGLTENKDAADLDGDGEVTSNDALIILQMVVGLRTCSHRKNMI
ncbi:MAG: dockerin type I repeat-containing protein [Oscillospiraceae bacterium]